MNAVFQIESNELNSRFLKTLREMFNGEKITIAVSSDVDEAEYLLSTESNRKMLERAFKAKEGFAFTPDEFEQISNNLEKGRKIKLSKLRKVKLSL